MLFIASRISLKGQERIKDRNEEEVAKLSVDDANDKYIIDVKINDTPVKCHVDLGSQCSLIKQSTSKELDLEVTVPKDLPVLRGIGANLIAPVGMSVCLVEVQNIKETVNMYIVEDFVIHQPVLLDTPLLKSQILL